MASAISRPISKRKHQLLTVNKNFSHSQTIRRYLWISYASVVAADVKIVKVLLFVSIFRSYKICLRWREKKSIIFQGSESEGNLWYSTDTCENNPHRNPFFGANKNTWPRKQDLDSHLHCVSDASLFLMHFWNSNNAYNRKSLR